MSYHGSILFPLKIILFNPKFGHKKAQLNGWALANFISNFRYKKTQGVNLGFIWSHYYDGDLTLHLLGSSCPVYFYISSIKISKDLITPYIADFLEETVFVHEQRLSDYKMSLKSNRIDYLFQLALTLNPYIELLQPYEV